MAVEAASEKSMNDWIKMSADLSEDPIVIAMAARLGVDEFSVVGRLHRIWGWADRHLADGLALDITPEWIDQFVRLDGFSKALIDAGWLYRFDKTTFIDPQQSLIDSFPETFIDSSLSLIDSYRNLIDSRDGGGLGGVVFPRFFRFLSGKTTKTTTKTKSTPTRARETDKAVDNATDKGIDNEIDNATDKALVQIDKDDTFAIFWKAYPRKDAKVQARKAFVKLAPSAALLEQIMSTLERFKRCDQWTRDGGKFVPFASTWLNQRRWEDETTPEMRQQPVAHRMSREEHIRAISDANGAAWLAQSAVTDPNVIDMEH